MNNIIRNTFFIVLVLGITGCGNFSPRGPNINNPNGKIEELKNNQNGLMTEIELLKNQLKISNSQLEKIQQGMLNIQSNNENSGIQIFSGQGGLIVAIVGFVCMTIVILHYRSKAKIYEKTSDILVEKIVESKDENLQNDIFLAVLGTKSEECLLNLVKKHKTFS